MSIIRRLYLVVFFVFFICSCATKKLVEVYKPLPPKNFQIKSIKVGAQLSGPTNSESSKFFADKTSEYGLDDVTSVHNYVVDYNGDGYSDLVILPDFYSVPQFFSFDPTSKKFIKEKESLFDSEVRCSSLYFVDLNADGVLDLIVITLNQKSELPEMPLQIFKGVVKTNKRVSYVEMKNAISLKPMPTSSVVVLDFNLDGKLDLFLGNWYTKSLKNGFTPDRLLQGGGDGFVFNDVSTLLEKEQRYDKELNLHPYATPTFGASSCDVDLNGFPDILVASSSGYSNKMWMNLLGGDGNRFFRDYGQESGMAADLEGRLETVGGGNTTFVNCIDYNNDKLMDLIVGDITPAFSPTSLDRSSILSGKTFAFPPQFIRSSYYTDGGEESWNQGDRRAVWLDYNFDGFVDVIVENSGFPPKSRLVLFSQSIDHSYNDVAENTGINILNPSGVVTADFNRDGKVDILTGQTKVRDASIKNRVYLYENIAPFSGKRTITISLRGKKGNRDGVGATIILRHGGIEQRRFVESVRGCLASQEEMKQIFGLGDANLDIKVDIVWPLLSSKKSESMMPVSRSYDLSGYKFNAHMELLLEESGKFTVLTMQ